LLLNPWNVSRIDISSILQDACQSENVPERGDLCSAAVETP
jgi:hypothetical protein